MVRNTGRKPKPEKKLGVLTSVYRNIVKNNSDKYEPWGYKMTDDDRVIGAIDARVTNNEKSIVRLEGKMDKIDAAVDGVKNNVTNLASTVKWFGIIGGFIISIVSPTVSMILTTVAIFALNRAS